MTPRTASLQRQLGVISATAIVVSNMIGTGIFTSTGYLAGDLGSAKLILIIWVVGALSALAGAFCYSELGINFPSSGGEYVYLTQAFGPAWGFMTGWISFFAGFSAPIALSALASANYLGYFFPALKQENSMHAGSGVFQLQFGGAQAVASAMVVAFTLVNCIGVRPTARLQNVLTGTKISVIVCFIVAGFLFGTGDWRHFEEPAVRTSTTPLFFQFFVSLVWVYVAYSGWNAATYVAEEVKHPARTLPLSLAVGTGFVAALFLALNVLYIYGVPLEKMKGQLAVGALAASNLFGPAIAGLFSAAMALSLLATVNAEITIGPRVYYAMAKNRAFFASAATVHPRWHTPVIAILAQGVCTILMTMTSFTTLMTYVGMVLNFFATLSVVSLLIFRRRPGWKKIGVVNFAYPLTPVVFIVVGVLITIIGMTFKPIVSLAAIATVGAGALVYRTRFRRQSA